MSRIYLTTTIPYVNAAPHIGFALEAVQADTLARHHRGIGDEVRLLTGTDDNSLKNVLSAEAAGLAVRDFVDRNAAKFRALQGSLDLAYDDFIATSRDPRHLPGVHELWRACKEDLYRARYEGLYCVGCEHFLTDAEVCPEHPAATPQLVSEENWFFRLSRYAQPLRDAITSGRLRIEPEARRNEVLALIDQGLRDFSVSRSNERARGWGITVPDDPDQVIYVWFDALGNYITSLGYGGDDTALSQWWHGADRRVHLIGKGVLRFHAVYWPAILLSAGLPLPTDILVHDYLTVDGRKISKSTGTPIDPVALAERYGADAVRWWLLREVPRVGDADFTLARLVARADDDLAGGIGNLVSRVTTLVHRFRGGRVGPSTSDSLALDSLTLGVPEEVAQALADFDFRRAAAAVWTVVERANRYVEQERPWELARAADEASSSRLDEALAVLVDACRRAGELLAPFLPTASARVVAQCTPVDGVLPPPVRLFPRIED
jgi:methionyl-tRNA synthetase